MTTNYFATTLPGGCKNCGHDVEIHGEPCIQCISKHKTPGQKCINCGCKKFVKQDGGEKNGK